MRLIDKMKLMKYPISRVECGDGCIVVTLGPYGNGKIMLRDFNRLCSTWDKSLDAKDDAEPSRRYAQVFRGVRQWVSMWHNRKVSQ